MKPSLHNQTPGKTSYSALKSKFFIIITLQPNGDTTFSPERTRRNPKMLKPGGKSSRETSPCFFPFGRHWLFSGALRTHYSLAGEQHPVVRKLTALFLMSTQDTSRKWEQHMQMSACFLITLIKGCGSRSR